ncbi:hypothetical protein ACFC1R_23045 [Kitasatospora sp. NPDC056138]|uniref:hypothetical protein n=1 Tax=Kitasatospora sp. NPDC056138 TaxID=3345724 RepID=UPI0035E3AB85
MPSFVKRLVIGLALALAALVVTPGAASADPVATVLYNQASDRCPTGGLNDWSDLTPCDDAHHPGKWLFKPVAGYPGFFTISAGADPRYCLTAFDGGVGNFGCGTGSTSQQWVVTPFQAGPTPLWDLVGVRLKSVSTGQCMDNTRKNFGGWKIYLFGCNDGAYQEWNIGKPAFAALGLGGHPGMTWANLEQRGDNVHVGYDAASNPYGGDTSASASLPLLCLNQDGRPAPAGIPAGGFHSWARGQVRATAPVQGSLLSSRARADGICAGSFGSGWRMAEFHDGEGWSFWAAGSLPTGVRFWTAINDQPANPWS